MVEDIGVLDLHIEGVPVQSAKDSWYRLRKVLVGLMDSMTLEVMEANYPDLALSALRLSHPEWLVDSKK